MKYAIFPPEEILQTTVNLPLSKSESARRLVIDAIGGYATAAEDVADCDDTRALMHALSMRNGRVDIGAAGTAMRFAAAFFAATEGTDIILDGIERMRHRPIAPLVEALRSLGADIEYTDADGDPAKGTEGYAPLHIRGRQLEGGMVNIDATVSSQFISALTLAAPLMRRPLRIVLEGDVTSAPYLHMTLEMLRRRGIDAALEGNDVCIQGSAADITAAETPVGRDWSAASYWYAIAALSSGWVTLPGLRLGCRLQGDSVAAEIFERLGVISEQNPEDEDTGEHIDGVGLSASPEISSRLDLDMSATPDLVPTLAVAATMLGVPFQFHGVHTLRDKETDRLDALCAEAVKLGALYEIDGDDSIGWEGRRVPIRTLPVIETYGDHRMAMAFAPAALYLPGLVIDSPEVVTKSYSGFWDDLRNAGFTITEVDEAAVNATVPSEDENPVEEQMSEKQDPGLASNIFPT